MKTFETFVSYLTLNTLMVSWTKNQCYFFEFSFLKSRVHTDSFLSDNYELSLEDRNIRYLKYLVSKGIIASQNIKVILLAFQRCKDEMQNVKCFLVKLCTYIRTFQKVPEFVNTNSYVSLSNSMLHLISSFTCLFGIIYKAVCMCVYVSRWL